MYGRRVAVRGGRDQGGASVKGVRAQAEGSRDRRYDGPCNPATLRYPPGNLRQENLVL